MVRALDCGYLLVVAGHFVARLGNRAEARKIASRYQAAGDSVKITHHGRVIAL